MECHRAIIQSLIGEREVTFMTNYNEQMTGLSSVEARQLQEQYSKDFLLLNVATVIFLPLVGQGMGGR